MEKYSIALSLANYNNSSRTIFVIVGLVPMIHRAAGSEAEERSTALLRLADLVARASGEMGHRDTPDDDNR